LEPAPSFPGIDKEFPICVGQPPSDDFPELKDLPSEHWKGKGTIRRTTGYIDPCSGRPYYKYEIKLEEPIHFHDYDTDKLWSTCAYAEHALGHQVGPAVGWFYMRIYVNGKWVRADRMAERLFNISVVPVCGSPGRWVERNAYGNPDPSPSTFAPWNPN
jgi:hypothetical protein